MLLENSHLRFQFEAATFTWHLASQHEDRLYARHIRLGAEGQSVAGARWAWREGLTVTEASQQVRPGPHGLESAWLMTAVWPRQPGLRWLAEFALPLDQPFLRWRLQVTNQAAPRQYLHHLTLAEMGARWVRSAPPARLHLPRTDALALFSNGYQSWSATGVRHADQRQPFSKMWVFGDSKHFNLLNPYAYQRGHMLSDMFGVLADRAGNSGVVLGSLAQTQQFSLLETRLDSPDPAVRLLAQADDVPLEPGETRLTDWAYWQFLPTLDNPFDDYAAAVARENAVRVPERVPNGWCSWYHYFDRVTEADVLNNVRALQAGAHSLPLEVVQVDDGFQQQVGDWFTTKPTFPRGLRPLADDIRQAGYTPGLWLAPFIARSDAALVRQHPEWFLRDLSGRWANAGFNWWRWCYALDPTHPGVREHTARLVHTAVHEWGYPYLKLDFLYAAALPGRRHDPTQTRAQALRGILQWVRQAAGDDTFLLGCGCPLGPAIGLFEAMRIGTDVGPHWHPSLSWPVLTRMLHDDTLLASTRNAVQNIITRSFMHRQWWLNDPDCLLVRDHATELSEAEVTTLATVIALSGGLVLVSDEWHKLNPKRLRYITALLPNLPQPARPRDWFARGVPNLLTLPLSGAAGDWLVVGLLNLGNLPHRRQLTLDDLGLPAGKYWVSDFWEPQVHRLMTTVPLTLPLAAHGARLLAVRRAQAGAQVVATAWHFSQGVEITHWEAGETSAVAHINLGRVAEGQMVVHVPRPLHRATLDGAEAAFYALGDDLWAVRGTVNGTATLKLAW